MADSSNSSNSSTGSQSTGSQAASNASVGSVTSGSGTTSNSNGNFSGGSLSSFSAASSPSLSFGNEAGPGFSRGDLSFSSNFGWTPSLSLDGSGAGKSTNMFTGATYDSATGQTTFGGNKGSSASGYVGQYGDTISVDSVFGKSDNSGTGTVGNKSVVESQGDYNATSNEKSNVETSTFGKQDNIAVTPESVTENKGLVDNSAIESIEGLNFQHKDKESQDVMEARKSRDEAEAEDKSNQMRDSLRAMADPTADEEAVNQFQIGDDDIDRAASERAQKAKDKADELQAEADKIKNTYDTINNQLDILKAEEEAKGDAFYAAKDSILVTHKWASSEDEYNKNPNGYEGYIDYNEPDVYQYRGTDTAFESKVNKANEAHADWQAATNEYTQKSRYANELSKKYTEAQKEADKYRGELDSRLNDIQDSASKLRSEVSRIKQEYKDGTLDIYSAVNQLSTLSLMADYSDFGFSTEDMIHLADSLDGKYLASNPSALQSSYVGAEEAPAVTPTSTESTVSDTKQTFDNVIQNAVEKGADEKTVQAMTDIATSIEDAQTEMKQAIEQNDIPTYIEAQKQYNKNLNEALEIGNALTQTDFNKDFVAAVAKANDFTVTLADGTQTTYSQFATEMVTKSPEVAKAMYEAKAQKYEAENHPVLAKIERTKAEMVGTWLGSKLTLADNQVRGQFNQMAKTNMRATYAAYNNVLNDANASPEAKAEASAAINQANGLMTASAALQASTGFLSGIGDSMSDGVYGVTDPTSLNTYQKTLNAIDNLAKITLGLAVSPGANKAYQNMHYMAGAKVNESSLFTSDFDGDGFALCQEYGNNAAAGMIAGAGELATGVALFFNPATAGMGLNLVMDSVQTFTNGLYGVQKDARKSEKYTQEVLNYFKEAQSIAADTGNKEALDAISNGITQIENFELKADEVGNLDNWLEGSGSNTATNEKFNQSLSYDEWLKLIEADPTMRDYAKKLIAEKKEK